MIPLLLLAALATAPEPAGITIVGRYGVGHACQVGPLVALTAAHVVARGSETFSMRWSDHAGNAGRLEAPAGPASKREDLAVMVSDRPFARWYEVAKDAPKVGDIVTVTGFQWGGRGRVLLERVVVTRVARVVAGHLELRDGAKPGSSGSCVLNALGELVAINVGELPVDGSLTMPAGWAVGVWGEWMAGVLEAAEVPLAEKETR